MLTISAKSVQKLPFAGYVLSENCSNLLYVDSSTAWLSECLLNLPSPTVADRKFHLFLFYYQDTARYIDPKTRQNFDYASAITEDIKLRKFITFELDIDEGKVIKPKHVLSATLTIVELKQIQSAKNRRNFPARITWKLLQCQIR